MSPGNAPRQSKGRGWMVAAIILLLLLGLSVLFNVGQMFSGVSNLSSGHSRGAGPRLEEITLKSGASGDKIAVIPVEGIITGSHIDGSPHSMVDVVKEQLKRADKDDDVRAVLLRVDSPGGEVLASDDIAKALRKFQKESKKPVIVSMGNLAASGGYYVSAPCRYIVANDLTITGSIGVIMSGLNYRGLMDKVGLKPQVYKSGKFKDMLSGSRNADEITPEETAMLNKFITDVFGKFKNVIAEGRKAAHAANKSDGRALADNWESFADGRILSGEDALKLGLVDQLGDFEDAVEKAEEIANISKAELIEYRQVSDLADLLRMFSKSDAKTVKIELGVDLPKLKANQPYFLPSTYLY